MNDFERGFCEELEKIAERANPRMYVYTPAEEEALAKRRALLGAGVGAAGGALAGALLGKKYSPGGAGSIAGPAMWGGAGGAALGAGAGYGAAKLQIGHRKKKRSELIADIMGLKDTPVEGRIEEMLPAIEMRKRLQFQQPQIRPYLI